MKTTTYGYDATKTQLTQVDGAAWSYDGNGNVTSNGTYNFKWDVAGRLTEVDQASDGSVIATYLYDDIGRRIQQTVNGQVTKFLYDGKSNRVLAEFDGSGNLTKYYYSWSPNGMLLSLTVNGTTYYTVRNGHGDIVQLTDVDGNTKDANGNVYASYTYDAWGNILSQTGTVASLNPYRYAGYRYDDATGLYYLTARYYDPSVGRFLSVDPESITSDYTYAGNNPLSYIDPNGHWIFDVAFLVLDVVTFIENPSWVTAAWIAVDLVSTAIPTGSISLAARAAKVINKAAHAAEMERAVGKATRIAAKGASEGAHAGAGITIVSGTYGQLRQAGVKDAYHIIQDAAVKSVPRYSRSAAPAVQLEGPSTRIGTPHYIATQIQRQSGGGTYAAERRIGYKALRRAGISENDARALIKQADDYCFSLGVTFGSTLRIPGNRR